MKNAQEMPRRSPTQDAPQEWIIPQSTGDLHLSIIMHFVVCTVCTLCTHPLHCSAICTTVTPQQPFTALLWRTPH